MPHGGKRQGAGRKKGSQNKATAEQRAVQKTFNERVLQHADRLFHAQLLAAEGCSMLFRRPKKGGALQRVTDEATIRKYFDDDLKDDPDYYFITTERPNADAADRMLNRAMGKAIERVEMGEPGDFSEVSDAELKAKLAEVVSRL